MARSNSYADGYYHGDTTFLTGTNAITTINENNEHELVSVMTGAFRIHESDTSGTTYVSSWKVEAFYTLSFMSESLYTQRVHAGAITPGGSASPGSFSDAGGSTLVSAWDNQQIAEKLFITSSFCIRESSTAVDRAYGTTSSIGNYCTAVLDATPYWLNHNPETFTNIPSVNGYNVAEFTTETGKWYEVFLAFDVLDSSSTQAGSVYDYKKNTDMCFGRPWVQVTPGAATFTLTKLSSGSTT